MNITTVRIRDRAGANVSIPMALWAVVMAIVIFMLEARLGSRAAFWFIGIGATALLGAYLGLRRRTAAAFIAPFVSWLFAWFPLVIAAMIHDGFLRGLVVGLFWITIGWIGIGALEFVSLVVVASFFRMLRGSITESEPGVMVFGPDGGSRPSWPAGT